MKNNPIVSENSTIDKETLASSQFSNLSRVKFVVGENVHCLYKVPFDHDLLDAMCPEGSMNQAYSQCFFYIFCQFHRPTLISRFFFVFQEIKVVL